MLYILGINTSQKRKDAVAHESYIPRALHCAACGKSFKLCHPSRLHLGLGIGVTKCRLLLLALLFGGLLATRQGPLRGSAAEAPMASLDGDEELRAAWARLTAGTIGPLTNRLCNHRC